MSRERALQALHNEIANCAHCVQAGYIKESSGFAGFHGHIGNRLMLIGQAPGRVSVERSLPFAGPGGKVLSAWLEHAGYPEDALYTQVYISALSRCYPGKSRSGRGDRRPSPAELALCRPFLLRELSLVRPGAILLVGSMAASAFIGSTHPLSEVIGKSYLYHGVRLLPLPHPSGVSRWLNLKEHQQLLSAALDILASWRSEWENQDCRYPPGKC